MIQFKKIFQKQGEGQAQLIRLYEYDRKGNLLKEETFSGYVSVISNEMSYDDEGRLTELRIIKLNGEESENWKYLYNEAGKLWKKMGYDSDGQLFEEHEYFFNEGGAIHQKVRTLHYINGGQFVHEYSYHPNNEVHEVCKNDEGEIEESWIRTYDEWGNLSSEQTFWQGEVLTAHEITQYDAKGRVVAEIYPEVPNSGEKFRQEVFIYGENDRLEEKQFLNKKGKVLERTTYHYNDEDVLQEKVTKIKGVFGFSTEKEVLVEGGDETCWHYEIYHGKRLVGKHRIKKDGSLIEISDLAKDSTMITEITPYPEA